MPGSYSVKSDAKSVGGLRLLNCQSVRIIKAYLP